MSFYKKEFRKWKDILSFEVKNKNGELLGLKMS